MMTPLDPFEVHVVSVFAKDLIAVWNLQSERNPVTPAALAAAPPPTPPTSAVTSNPTVTLDNLRELDEVLKAVPRAFLTVLAEAGSVDRSVKYESLREAGAAASNNPGFTYHQVRGNLAWLTKGMIKVTGANIRLFKFTLVDMNLTAGERYEVRMSKAIADMWLQVIGRR